MNHPPDLTRFLQAQETDYPIALAEIQKGRKVSHWMWYIFPQLRALGKSSMATYYGIEDMEEARAYMAHRILSARLVEISEALLGLHENDPVKIMGEIDAQKLRSCMTLFAHAAEDEDCFVRVLNKFYGGAEDRRTLEKIYPN